MEKERKKKKGEEREKMRKKKKDITSTFSGNKYEKVSPGVTLDSSFTKTNVD